MDLPPSWSVTCVCGRTFSVPQAYTYHKHSCQKTKKRLAGALEKAREIWHAKKRRKTEAHALSGPSNMNTIAELVQNEAPTPSAQEVRFPLPILHGARSK
jgi:hypothetical protein